MGKGCGEAGVLVGRSHHNTAGSPGTHLCLHPTEAILSQCPSPAGEVSLCGELETLSPHQDTAGGQTWGKSSPSFGSTIREQWEYQQYHISQASQRSSVKSLTAGLPLEAQPTQVGQGRYAQPEHLALNSGGELSPTQRALYLVVP